MSGALALLQTIRRSGSGLLQLSDQTVASLNPSPATAGYRLNSSGVAQSRVQNTYATLESWLISGAASDYEFRATLLSGTLSAGTVGSWLAGNSSPEWNCTDPTVDGVDAEATILVEGRLASTGPVIDSATIVITATRE